MALLLNAGWPTAPAILVGLGLGAAIGLAQGAWIVGFRAPSFIVTLTGLLVWQGFQLLSLQGQNGQLRVDDPFLTGIATNYLPMSAGWALAAVVILATAAFIGVRRRLQLRSSYGAGPIGTDVTIVVVVAVLSLAVVGLLNTYLGVPYLLLILLALTLVSAVVAGSTVFGRHIYAVGGNAEAARRAGIRVGSLKLAIFTAASLLAALGGALEAGRAFSVSVTSGGGNTSLDAIAAAVIGGTSLFGGRGRLAGALLGALVISSVANGLDLLGGSAAQETIATGLILLAAITLDVTSRRQRQGQRRRTGTNG
jgi:D-xylose transport system permease protein